MGPSIISHHGYKLLAELKGNELVTAAVQWEGKLLLVRRLRTNCSGNRGLNNLRNRHVTVERWVHITCRRYCSEGNC